MEGGGGESGWGDYSREAINRGTAIIQGGTYELRCGQSFSK